MTWTRRVLLASLGVVLLPSVKASSSDLDEVLLLLQNVALGERGSGIYLNREQLLRELIVAQDVTFKGQAAQQVEHTFLRGLIKKQASPKDRFYDPQQAQQLLTSSASLVEGKALEGDRAYIQLKQIDSRTLAQVALLLHQFTHDQGLILDLRGASGNDPQALADLGRVFIAKTPLFNSLLNKNQRQDHLSKARTIAADMPLVVIVDGETRASAEALAGGLQLMNRASIIGTRTSGDGFRTAVYELPSGAAVELVMARWQVEGNATLSPVIPDREVLKDPLSAAINVLASQPVRTLEVTVFPDRGRIGKYNLGFDAGSANLGVAGLVEGFSPDNVKRVIRPKEELKIWYLGDYWVFLYRPQASLFTFFADRIYSLTPNTLTAQGIRMGSTYAQVTAAYGGPDKNGYVERFPFPVGARGDTPDRYCVDYDALGLSFIFSSGSNRVQAIGLFKSGS